MQTAASHGHTPARPSDPLPLEAPAARPVGDLPRWVYWLVLAVLTAAGAVMRAVWLDHPMRYDESWGFVQYILPRDLVACLFYSAPNNHVLHTLLVAVASAIGGDGPVALRMPAFLAGVALIPAAAHLATVLSGRRLAGLLTAAFVASSGILVEYSVNGRGYSLVYLAAVLLTERTARIVRDVRPRGPWVVWALVATVGMITIPLMLYPMVVLAVVIVLQAFLGPADAAARRLTLRRLGATLAGTVALAGLLYLPVVHVTGRAITQGDAVARASPVAVYGSGLHALIANPFVAPKTLSQAAAGLTVIAGETVAIMRRDMSWIGWILVALGLVAAVLAGVRQRRVLFLLPLLLPVVLVVLALAQRVVPFTRAWLFALPVFLAVASCGLVRWAWGSPPGRLRGLAVAAVTLAVVAATGHAAWRVQGLDHLVSADIFRVVNRGDICLLDARAIVTDGLELADGHTDLAWAYELPYWPPLAYYMVTLSSSSRHFVPYMLPACRRALMVVPSGQTLEGILGYCPQLAAEYGQIRLWRSYPSAEVFLAWRRGTTPSEPSSPR